MAGFSICACYGGHVWRNIKIHDARSFGKVQDHRKCAFCPQEEVRDRFLGAAIRTEGTWRKVEWGKPLPAWGEAA